jgi:hydroxymethylbilane synthase
MDALITADGRDLPELPEGARVGTTSLRRKAQLLSYRSDLRITPLRGNVDTRIGKVTSGELDATVLAVSGLLRLKGDDYPVRPLDPALMLPAPGQGQLGLELREEDKETAALLRPLNHALSEAALSCERAFMKALGAGCQTPAAAWARAEGDLFLFSALVAEEDGSRVLKEETRIPLSSDSALAGEAERTGRETAEKLLARGAGDIIARAEGRA